MLRNPGVDSLPRDAKPILNNDGRDLAGLHHLVGLCSAEADQFRNLSDAEKQRLKRSTMILHIPLFEGCKSVRGRPVMSRCAAYTILYCTTAPGSPKNRDGSGTQCMLSVVPEGLAVVPRMRSGVFSRLLLSVSPRSDLSGRTATQPAVHRVSQFFEFRLPLRC